MKELPEAIAFGRRIRVIRWVDPTTEEGGYDARSKYVERFWLPVLGPSKTSIGVQTRPLESGGEEEVRQRLPAAVPPVLVPTAHRRARGSAQARLSARGSVVRYASTVPRHGALPCMRTND
jgi:hypothetical protein